MSPSPNRISTSSFRMGSRPAEWGESVARQVEGRFGGRVHGRAGGTAGGQAPSGSAAGLHASGCIARADGARREVEQVIGRAGSSGSTNGGGGAVQPRSTAEHSARGMPPAAAAPEWCTATPHCSMGSMAWMKGSWRSASLRHCRGGQGTAASMRVGVVQQVCDPGQPQRNGLPTKNAAQLTATAQPAAAASPERATPTTSPPPTCMAGPNTSATAAASSGLLKAVPSFWKARNRSPAYSSHSLQRF